MMNNNDDSTPYVISNEHYLRILMEYLPRELDSIVRLSSKSFNRVLVDINNTIKSKIITGNQLIEYLIINGMISLFDFAKESGCKIGSRYLCDIAARNGQIDFLKHLRCKRYPFNDKSAMISAASGGYLQMMIYLHEEVGCEWPADICYHSASGGNVDCLDYGHQHGCIDVTSSSGIASCINATSKTSGESPLHAASRGGHLHMVRELLDRGADVNFRVNNNRNTRLLLFGGLWSNHKLTSLMIASQGGHVDVVRELLNRGADIIARTEDGMNSLMTASREGHVDVVRELLDRGADITASKMDGMNSLMLASRESHVDVVRELLVRGADIKASTYYGWNSLTAASIKGHVDVVRELLNRGADISFRMVDGSDSLMLASQQGHFELVRELLNRRADINGVAKDGSTALSLASSNDHHDIVRILEEHGAVEK